MILHLEDDEVTINENAQLSDSPPPDPDHDESAMLHLSLHAMQGSSDVGTIKVLATIQGHPVQVLINGGNNDNFLHS